MNLEHLVQPLTSAHGPCGDDLIFSAEFDDIQEARRFDDPSLSQGEWITHLKEADWVRVVHLCEDILRSKSKDLRVAAWLTEARCKLHGLRGLADGYVLLSNLCKSFWNEIHPLAEDDDIEQRVGALDWLANQTARLIREVPLTHSEKGDFSLTDLASARATAKQIERNAGSVEESAGLASITLDIFDASLKDTPPQHFVDGMQNAEDLKVAIKSLQTFLDATMAEYSPAFGQTLEALDDVFLFFQRNAGKTVSAPIQKNPTETNLSATVSERSGEQADLHEDAAEAKGGPIRTREQAIRQLQEIGAFFRRTEPHSPVAYLAEKAAKWGSMPLHEWLRTVIKDDSALLRMEELLGVDPKVTSEHD